jgi:hypothetical protein
MLKSISRIILAGSLILLVAGFALDAMSVAAQDPRCYVDMGDEDAEEQRENRPQFCDFKDDRINTNDGAATATIYCLADGGVAIWDINLMSQGELALTVSPDQISAVPTLPAENTFIAGEGGIDLYRLTSGQLQVIAPPNYSTEPVYVFAWDGCEP